MRIRPAPKHASWRSAGQALLADSPAAILQCRKVLTNSTPIQEAGRPALRSHGATMWRRLLRKRWLRTKYPARKTLINKSHEALPHGFYRDKKTLPAKNCHGSITEATGCSL